MHLLELQYPDFYLNILLAPVKHFQQITPIFAAIIWLRNDYQIIQSVIVHICQIMKC